MVANAPVANVAAVAPTDKSVRGAAAQREKPPARAFERPVVARTAPPAAPAGLQRSSSSSRRSRASRSMTPSASN